MHSEEFVKGLSCGFVDAFFCVVDVLLIFGDEGLVLFSVFNGLPSAVDGACDVCDFTIG